MIGRRPNRWLGICARLAALFALFAMGFWWYARTHSRTAAQMILDDARVIDAAIEQYSVAPGGSPDAAH